MFKAIAGVIGAFFVLTSGAPSQRFQNHFPLDARNNEDSQHLGILREFYVFPAFLKGKFAKRKVGYLVFSNFEIDKPRFLSLKDKRYDKALELIQASGVYTGGPADRAFSPLFDSSVYRKPSFTIRRGIIIPKNEEKILQRKTEASEVHITDDNFESSLIQRLQELKKESQSRSSGINQEQGMIKQSQDDTNNSNQKSTVSDSGDSLTHMAFESDVGFDVELEGFLNNESAMRNSQDSNINANDDDQEFSRVSGTHSGDSNKFDHTSTGINSKNVVDNHTDRLPQTSVTDNGNDGDFSEFFNPANQQHSENESISPILAVDDIAAKADRSTFSSPISSLHLSTDEIVQAILDRSDSDNAKNSQDDLPRIPFKIFDGTLVANRFGSSASTFNDDTVIASSILTVPYTKSESLLLINQGKRTENGKPIYIKTYVLRFGHKNRHSIPEDSLTSDSSLNSKPSAVILGFRDAVNHGLTDGVSEVISVRLVEDDFKMKENLRNKRHIFTFDIDDISIEVLE